MSDKIERYLNGDFDYEGGSLIFSCSKIEIGTLAGKESTGEFCIEEQSGKEFTGKVYSSHLTMECLTPEFSGSSVTISYQTNIQGRMPGDVLKGELYIVSNMGEYVIPYVINVTYENIESSLGPIKNLFHFTNLAKCNWDEAVSLFYEDDFAELLVGNDRKYRSLYKGLIATGTPNHNLEEFLIGINKKQAVEYTVDRDHIRLINPERITTQTIRVNYAGWGYVKLKVKSQGDFIVLERKVLSADDFQGNTCEYVFYIDENGLHDGNNFGKITFVHAYGSFEVDINVVCVLPDADARSRRQEKKAIYRLTRTYLDFRLKHLSKQKCVTQMKELFAYFKNISESYVSSSLAEAHLMIVQEKYNEAKWLLDHAIGDPEDLEDENYCYYLYLTALYSADEFYTLEVTERVKSIYQKNPGNWRIAWVYMYLSPELNKSAAAKWTFAMELLNRDCTSPFIYIELITLLNSNPALIGHLETEHLRVLFFGAKNQYLSNELSSQIVSAAARVKQYNRQLFRILEMIYERKQDKTTLQAICTLLMKGEREDTLVHRYYAQGVEYSLPITRLYEYYMMSLDLNASEEIPKGVLMYFSYECNLPVGITAFLYKYMYVNRNKYADLYELYRPHIARFLVKQLYAEKLNANLAYLYQEILVKEMLTPDNAAQFANIMFVNCIRIERKGISYVAILDERLNKESLYPVNNGMAFVNLFSNDYTILLEDEKGNRYIGTDDYQIECFFLPRKFVPYVEPHAKDSLPYDLFVCGGYQDLFIVTKESCKRFCYLEQSEELDFNYQCNIRMSLLNYYFEQDDVDALNELLPRIDAMDVPVKNRADFVRMLSVHGYIEKAYELIQRYGVENIEPKTIVRVCTSMVEQKQDIYDYYLVRVIYSAFERGKYNDIVLGYLVKHYTGSAKILRNIWKAAMNFDMDTHEICERILVQVMDTGVFIGEEEKVYSQYVMGGPKLRIELAYLSYVCFEYIVFDRVLKPYVFLHLERIYSDEKMLPDVCMLAYLQYFSTDVEGLNYEQKRICREFIRILYRGKRIVMPYFADYKSISLDAESMSHSTLITYKGNPKSNVVIHYMMNRDAQDETGYVKETMDNMFGGIYVKEFVLFFGESLQYYITEEYANKEQLTESGTIQNNDAMEEEIVSRFSMVNDIAVATTLKDYSTAKELLKEYAEREYIAKELFSLQ